VFYIYLSAVDKGERRKGKNAEMMMMMMMIIIMNLITFAI
jgi:hypothetical protein